MNRVALIIFISLLSSKTGVFAEEALKLATTTSTYETGLLDYILPPFENKHNIKVHTISVGTGKAVKLGENGDVDIILVHDKEAEEKFVREGFGVNRRYIMYNDFVILGPGNDRAGVMGLKCAKDVLKKIADSKYTFVSRGDDSGTNRKEKFLWREAGINPSGNRYLETGQGMGATLRIAEEKDAYVLADRATYLSNRASITLAVVSEGDEALFNPYSVIAVNPKKHAHVKYGPAMAMIEWLTSPECRRMINEYKINEVQLFFAP